jgi:hypothetical protein
LGPRCERFQEHPDAYTFKTGATLQLKIDDEKTWHAVDVSWMLDNHFLVGPLDQKNFLYFQSNFWGLRGFFRREFPSLIPDALTLIF